MFAKSAEQIETIRPNVAASIFDEPVSDEEIEAEVEVEPSEEE